MRRLSFLLWIVAATTTQAVAEDASRSIEGTVIDASTGQPLRDVAVTATDPASGEETVVVTDATGKFSLRVSGGALLLRFDAGGYRSLEQTVTLQAGAPPAELEVELVEEPFEPVGRGCTLGPIDTTSSTVGEALTDVFWSRYPLR